MWALFRQSSPAISSYPRLSLMPSLPQGVVLLLLADCVLLSRLTVSCFLFTSLRLEIFPGIDIVKVAMTHLWSLPMRIMSLASASLMCFKCLLFVSMYSICFSLTLRDMKGRLFLKCLSEHRVEVGVILKHQPAFQPVTSFVSLVHSVSADTFTFRSFSRSQLSIEVSSNDWKCIYHCAPCGSRLFCTSSQCGGPHI